MTKCDIINSVSLFQKKIFLQYPFIPEPIRDPRTICGFPFTKMLPPNMAAAFLTEYELSPAAGVSGSGISNKTIFQMPLLTGMSGMVANPLARSSSVGIVSVIVPSLYCL